MDKNYPHEIRPEDEIPPKRRKEFMRLTDEAARELGPKSPEERARWLAAFRARTINVAKTSAVAEKVRERLQSVVNPLIDKLDEDGTDEENVPLLLGWMVGARLWAEEFAALEDRALGLLEQGCGVTRDGYARMRAKAEAEGIRGLAAVEELMREGEPST